MTNQIKVNHDCLGVHDLEAKRHYNPSKYATGALWNKFSSPYPTRVYFRKEGQYKFFYMLPPNVAKASNDTLSELNAAVDSFLSSQSTSTTTSKRSTTKQKASSTTTKDTVTGSEDSTSGADESDESSTE